MKFRFLLFILVSIVFADTRHKLTLDKGFIFVGPNKDHTSFQMSVSEEVHDDPKYIQICRRLFWFNYQCSVAEIKDGTGSFSASKFPEGSYKVSLLKEKNSKPFAFSKTVKLLHVGALNKKSPLDVKRVDFKRVEGYLSMTIMLRKRVSENIIVSLYDAEDGKRLVRVKVPIDLDRTVTTKVKHHPERAYYMEIHAYQSSWAERFRSKTLVYRAYADRGNEHFYIPGSTSLAVVFRGKSPAPDLSEAEMKAHKMYIPETPEVIFEQPSVEVTGLPNELSAFDLKNKHDAKKLWDTAYRGRLKSLPISDIAVPSALKSLYGVNPIDLDVMYIALQEWLSAQSDAVRQSTEIVHPGFFEKVYNPEDFAKIRYERQSRRKETEIKRYYVIPHNVKLETRHHWAVHFYDARTRLFIYVDSIPHFGLEGEQFPHLIATASLVLSEFIGLPDVPAPRVMMMSYVKHRESPEPMLIHSAKIEGDDPFLKSIGYWNNDIGFVDYASSGLYAIKNVIDIVGMEADDLVRVVLKRNKEKPKEPMSKAEVSRFRKTLFTYLGVSCQENDPVVNFPDCLDYGTTLPWTAAGGSDESESEPDSEEST